MDRSVLATEIISYGTIQQRRRQFIRHRGWRSRLVKMSPQLAIDRAVDYFVASVLIGDDVCAGRSFQRGFQKLRHPLSLDVRKQIAVGICHIEQTGRLFLSQSIQHPRIPLWSGRG